MEEKYLSIGKKVEAMKEGIQDYKDDIPSCELSRMKSMYQRYDSPWYKDEYMKYAIIGFADEAARSHNYYIAKDAYDIAGVSETKHAQRYMKEYKKEMDLKKDKESSIDKAALDKQFEDWLRSFLRKDDSYYDKYHDPDYDYYYGGKFKKGTDDRYIDKVLGIY